MDCASSVDSSRQVNRNIQFLYVSIRDVLAGGDNEYGFVTLGAVECWGIDPDYNPEDDDNYNPYAYLIPGL